MSFQVGFERSRQHPHEASAIPAPFEAGNREGAKGGVDHPLTQMTHDLRVTEAGSLVSSPSRLNGASAPPAGLCATEYGRLGELIGASSAMCDVFGVLRQAGPNKVSVLITGESGTGKEVVARTLHALSARSHGQFVALNCAALPESLIESELFGHEKGAFTGAFERRAGCFEAAHRGTLLLDEIGEMPIQTQAKLLRFLEDSRIRPVGGTSDFEVDVRILAATNRNPEEAVRLGHLREDLFYRLNVFRVHLPPLRQRKSDIPMMVNALLKDLNSAYGSSVSAVSGDVMEAFQRHNWPGNIRELRNTLERAVILAGSGTIEPMHLPPRFRSEDSECAPAAATTSANSGCLAVENSVELRPGTSLAEAEQRLILSTLRHTGQDKVRAARILGVTVRTIRNKLKHYGATTESDAWASELDWRLTTGGAKRKV